jgi:hypothetical protein
MFLCLFNRMYQREQEQLLEAKKETLDKELEGFLR